MPFFMRRPGDEPKKPVVVATDQMSKQTQGKVKKSFQIFKKKPFYAFIDASNLFWGGERSVGFKIDYKKLLEYLSQTFNVQKVFYYGGVRIFDFEYNILDNKPLDLPKLAEHLEKLKTEVDEKEIPSIDKSLNKVNFYITLQNFGYVMKIKPAKVHFDEDDDNEENPILKANCDVDMTFDMMRYMEQYSGLVVMTGDGDFAPVLNYLKNSGRPVKIVSRWQRTAKEIKELAGKEFVEFENLKNRINYL